MAINLIGTVRSFITPEVADRASAHLGESREGIDKAVAAGIPALFAGFVHRAEHGDAQGLLTEAKEAATHNMAETAGTLFSGGVSDQPTGTGWGSHLVGGNFNALAHAIASYAGIKSSSATSLLNLLGPLSMGTLGQHALDNRWDAGGLSSFLASQKSFIMSAVPAGLHMEKLLGTRVYPQGTVPPSHAHQAGHEMARRQPRTYWLWIVLLVLALVALLIYLYMRNNDRAEPGVKPPAADTTAQVSQPTSSPPMGEPVMNSDPPRAY
jgi:hypothetical protein